MQRNDAAEANNGKLSARAAAQLERVAAFRAVQIRQVVLEELISFGCAYVDMRFIVTTMPGKCFGGPGWKYKAKSSHSFLGTLIACDCHRNAARRERFLRRVGPSRSRGGDLGARPGNRVTRFGEGSGRVDEIRNGATEKPKVQYLAGHNSQFETRFPHIGIASRNCLLTFWTFCYSVNTEAFLTMNKSIAELVERFGIEPEAALRVLANMEIDFSECSQEEFNKEALRAHEFLVQAEEVENLLRKADDEFTKALLDIMRPVDPRQFSL